MKVIVIKDFKNGSRNQILDVKPGYAINFLFKNNLAKPYTTTNKEILESEIANRARVDEIEKAKSLKLKAEIEKIVLHYELLSVNEKVHGSITSQNIINDLKNHQVIVSKFALKNHRFNKIGENIVEITLPQNIHAQLVIKITKK